MPLYDFRDKTTGEIIEKRISLAEFDDFMKENPNLERYLGNQQLNFYEGVPKIDGGMKEVLTRIKTHHHESTIQV